MAMYQTRVTLTKPPGLVKQALIRGEVSRFFRQRGALIVSARNLKWYEGGDALAIGKFSFWTGGKFTALGYLKVQIHPTNMGSIVTISAENTTYANIVIPIAYALGVLMCVVGVVLPILGLRIVKKRFASYAEEIKAALIAWDSSMP